MPLALNRPVSAAAACCLLPLLPAAAAAAAAAACGCCLLPLLLAVESGGRWCEPTAPWKPPFYPAIPEPPALCAAHCGSEVGPRCVYAPPEMPGSGAYSCCR